MIKDIIHMQIEMEQQMSSNAKRLGDEYFELKLQLRFRYFDQKDLHESSIIPKKDKYGNVVLDDKGKEIMVKQKPILKKFGDIVEKEFNGINKVEELDNGFDFFFGSLGEMSKISRYFGKYFLVENKHSKKIVGKDFLKFKDIWRHTLLISVLNLNVGDKVRIKGEEYYIKAFNKKEMVLREWNTGAKEVVSYTKVKDYFELIEKGAWNRYNGKTEEDSDLN
jgi:hypothetical protein